MNLYYIDAPNGSPGDNLNLFVSASTPDEAIALWIAAYKWGADEDSPEDKIDTDLVKDARISLVPAVGTNAAAHLWDTITSWNISSDGRGLPHTPRD